MAEKIYLGNIQNCPNCDECWAQGLNWKDVEACGKGIDDNVSEDEKVLLDSKQIR